jgi:menaquinone-dependent protoporphyrinogen oxidase
LLVYSSTHGHTAKIAQRMGEALRAEELDVDVLRTEEAQRADPRTYDGVIVGGSLHGGHHQDELRDWVSRHRVALASGPSAFFSVSLTAAEDSDEARTETRDRLDDFLDDTGWTPTCSVSLAGALQYQEYDPFTRILIRLMMRHGGHPTDISRDHDFTDWPAVERFGREFARLVRSARATPPSATPPSPRA